MGIQAVYSIKKSIDEAISDLSVQITDKKPKAVIFFASSNYEPVKLSKAVKDLLPDTTVIGCTTAGEIVSGKMLENSLVALILGDDIVEDLCVEMLENIQSEIDVHPAFSRFGTYFKAPVSDLDISKHAGIILIDGLSGAEERCMDAIGDLTNLTFIGGAAGDDLKFQKTHVYCNGKAYSNAAVLMLLKLKRGFDIIKTQSFCSTGKKLVATSVKEKVRTVTTFNNKPASIAYASVLNCSEKDASGRFMRSPLGLMIGEEPYIRSPQRFDGKSMVFYCNIKEGMELDVLQCTDIIKDTKNAVEKKLSELGTISGIIDFHCILRTLELREKNLCEAYGLIFKNIPAVGFSTYGEEYIGHINQTSTMLVFK